MKYFKHALLAAAIAASAAVHAAPKVALEAPEANSIQSGITQIYGWASDVEPVVKVELYIDGNESQTMVLGSAASAPTSRRRTRTTTTRCTRASLPPSTPSCSATGRTPSPSRPRTRAVKKRR